MIKEKSERPATNRAKSDCALIGCWRHNDRSDTRFSTAALVTNAQTANRPPIRLDAPGAIAPTEIGEPRPTTAPTKWRRLSVGARNARAGQTRQKFKQKKNAQNQPRALGMAPKDTVLEPGPPLMVAPTQPKRPTSHARLTAPVVAPAPARQLAVGASNKMAPSMAVAALTR